MPKILPWPREPHPESREPVAVHLFAFAPGELDLEAELRPDEHGIPEGFSDAILELAYIDRVANPQWVEGFFDPSVEALARRSIGDAFDAVKGSGGVYAISYLDDESASLGPLQTVWAFARYLASLGATAVLDAGAQRWWSAEALLARRPDRAFRIEDEIDVVFEPGESAGYVHTRGMAKFGRPEVALEQVRERHRARAVDLVTTLAEALAGGRVLRAGDAIALDDGIECVFRELRPGEADPDLGLGERALIARVPALGRD